MNIIKKLMLLIKSIFIKQNEVKKLEESKIKQENINQREKFIKSLKIPDSELKTKKKVETLICEGDGLGIQKKITC